MLIKLSGIAAKEAGTSEYKYEGKLTKKDLLLAIRNNIPSLKNIKLEIAVNSECNQKDGLKFSNGDDVFVFNAFAGG